MMIALARSIETQVDPARQIAGLRPAAEAGSES
jgi:hypothetical protein